MTLISGQITERLPTMRGHNRAMNKLFYTAVVTIRDEFLPHHFTRDAFRRYGFKARGVRYTRWKRKVVGHNLPNVFSGELKGEVLLRSHPTSTSDHGNLRIRMGQRGQYMSGPRKGQFYKRALPEERRQEMSVVSDSERYELAEDFLDGYVYEMELENSNRILKRLRRRTRV